MSFHEILEELPSLSEMQRHQIAIRLDELELGSEFVPTPEMIHAVEEACLARQERAPIAIEEARQKVTQWATKSF
jgi:hypothetical protein